MEIAIIAILLIVAIIFFLVELFVLPGISIAGILAGGCYLYANYYAFTHLGMAGGFTTLGISAVACVLCLVWFMRSKTLDRISLKTDITGSVDRTAEQSVKVGDTGVTTTRLALVGHADIAGHLVEVNSADGFLDEKTPVTILYGSEARGEAREDSDIDLLVLLSESRLTPERELEIVSQLYKIELETGVIISPMIMSRKTWEDRPFHTPFSLNVMKEGVTL